MATTYTADQAAATVQPRAGVGHHSVVSVYELTAALVVNDVIQMCHVPKGAVITRIALATDDLDTHGSPTIVLDVGDGDNTDRFIDGATIGQSSGIQEINEVDGYGYQYAADDTIDVLVQVAPATGASSGSVKLTVEYTMHDDV
jgi:hypothetical protein